MKGKGVSIKLLFMLLLTVLLGTGCSSIRPVTLNVHTEPEGAHVIYSVNNSRWIYLGVTPLEVVEVIDEDDFDGEERFTLRTMRSGYFNQSKEWTVEQLLEENDKKGVIFWTPRLIKND